MYNGNNKTKLANIYCSIINKRDSEFKNVNRKLQCSLSKDTLKLLTKSKLRKNGEDEMSLLGKEGFYSRTEMTCISGLARLEDYEMRNLNVDKYNRNVKKLNDIILSSNKMYAKVMVSRKECNNAISVTRFFNETRAKIFNDTTPGIIITAHGSKNKRHDRQHLCTRYRVDAIAISKYDDSHINDDEIHHLNYYPGHDVGFGRYGQVHCKFVTLSNYKHRQKECKEYRSEQKYKSSKYYIDPNIISKGTFAKKDNSKQTIQCCSNKCGGSGMNINVSCKQSCNLSPGPEQVKETLEQKRDDEAEAAKVKAAADAAAKAKADAAAKAKADVAAKAKADAAAKAKADAAAKAADDAKAKLAADDTKDKLAADDAAAKAADDAAAKAADDAAAKAADDTKPKLAADDAKAKLAVSKAKIKVAKAKAKAAKAKATELAIKKKSEKSFIQSIINRFLNLFN